MQNLKKILKNKKGFTLVELMVVVAILGILVAIAVPVYSNVTANAAEKACASNIRTIESAIVMAQADQKVINNGADISVLSEYLKTTDLTCPVNESAEYTLNVDGDKVTVNHTHGTTGGGAGE